MDAPTLPPTTDGMGIGPRDVQAGATAKPDDAERDRRIRELFFEAHGAALVAMIDGGECGIEMQRTWRRHRTVGEKFWPCTEKRKARKT